MARIVWTISALNELDEIADYISLDNHLEAKNLVHAVFERVELLNKHPEIGKIVDSLGGTFYREIIFPPCRIFYRLEKSFIYIIHVIREEQNFFPSILTTR